ncbi:MAG TPA: CHAD domain-containing protein [Flavobacteriales bacterium]|nr:CHAD domain-containing protein [Flavobacteriales bacterium]
MLPAKKIYKKIRGHGQRALERLDHFSKHADPEDLHQLRVEIKKTKALLKFYLRPKKAFNELFAPVRKLFKEAGELRTIQLTLELMDNYAIENTRMEDKLNKQLLYVNLNFCKHIEKKRKSASRSIKRFDAYLKPVKKSSIHRRIHKKKDEIEACLRTSKTDLSSLHDCRKKMKILMYVLNGLKPGYAKKAFIDIKKLDKLQDLIGKWHDLQLAHDFLKKSRTSIPANLTTEEKKVLNKIISLTENPASFST